MLKQFGVMLLGITLISACALSPQEIDVLPVIDVGENRIARGQRVFVQVADSRKDPSFGTRGGVYPETSFIKPRGDLALAVHNAVLGVLRRYGFDLAAAQADRAAVTFRVDIEKIRYLSSGDPVVRHVDTESSLNARCNSGANRFESRYEARLGRDVLKPPSAKENESLINAVLSKGLQAMMSDQGLLDCLSGRAR
ncbi:MAG: YajG family lipoprotein [Gammaproteobacteria bacterium]